MLFIDFLGYETYKNQNSFISSIDHNDSFDHKYSIDPDNVLNIYCSMLKYHYLSRP